LKFSEIQRHIFLKFSEIRRIQTGLSLKTAKNTVHYFKILEKDKKQQKKICKKTRSNSKITGEEIFVKTSRLG
jgi:hypothetical protein